MGGGGGFSSQSHVFVIIGNEIFDEPWIRRVIPRLQPLTDISSLLDYFFLTNPTRRTPVENLRIVEKKWRWQVIFPRIVSLIDMV